MTTELITIEIKTPMEIFTKENGVDPILEAIKNEVAKFKPDISTPAGREAIASLAYKVAKTKTYMDKLGASLTEDMKKQVKVVDVSRSKIWDALETLQKETRKPLTDWENLEKTRVETHEAAIKTISTLGLITNNGVKLTLPDLKKNLITLEATVIDDSWQEFKTRATLEKEFQFNSLTREISEREKYESEQAELKKLREQNAAREIKEREAKIAQDAADKARKDAEDKAQADKQREEQERQEVARKQKEEADKVEAKRLADIRKVADERDQAERDAQDAINRQKKAEQDLADQKEKNRLDQIKAAEDLKKSNEQAIEAERLRVKKQKDLEDIETKAREKDKEHKKTINNEALNDLMMTAGLMEPQAKVVITAIAKGLIKHVKINY